MNFDPENSIGSSDRGDQMEETMGDSEDTQESTSSNTSGSTATKPRSEATGSLVEYYGPSASYCGYCKQVDMQSNGGRRSYDMHAYRLTASDYQDLLDRGWRRSGEFCYAPINQTTCCPNYPIICHAMDFNLTGSQRKCIKRLNNFLVTGSVKQSASIEYSDQSQDLFRAAHTEPKCNKSYESLKKSSKSRDRRFVKACERLAQATNLPPEEAMNLVNKKWQQRRYKPLSLEDYLFPRLVNPTEESTEANHKLEINMYHVESQHSRALRDEEHSIMVQYQANVHQEVHREWTMSRYCDFLIDSPIITGRLKDYDYLKDVGDEDDLTRDILSKNVHSNSESKPFRLHRPAQLPTCYGTYHCTYHLDRKLIAVGVLDVLPKCITTVYFFYDPQYAFLNLGIYSVLVEISMVRQMWSRYKGVHQEGETTDTNQLKYYHLGYYVHECKKMHYKTRFKPSYLLCCKSFEYVQTEECLEKLKHAKFAEFGNASSISAEAASREAIGIKNLLEVSVEWPRSIEGTNSSVTTLLNYVIWLETNLGTEYVELFVNGYLATFAHLVGADLLGKLCLKTDVVHNTLLRRRDRLAQSKQRSAPNSHKNQQERAI